jgi:hypothetical protein
LLVVAELREDQTQKLKVVVAEAVIVHLGIVKLLEVEQLLKVKQN